MKYITVFELWRAVARITDHGMMRDPTNLHRRLDTVTAKIVHNSPDTVVIRIL